MSTLITQAKIISKEEAKVRGWDIGDQIHDFLNRYNDSQSFFLNKPNSGVFKSIENEILPKNLTKTTFIHALLEGVDLTNSDLEGADIRWAHMEGANLNGAKINKKALKQTKFWEGASLINTQLYDNGELLSPEESRKIIEAHMKENNINVIMDEPKVKGNQTILSNAKKTLISTLLAFGLVATPFNIAAEDDDTELNNHNNNKQIYEQTISTDNTSEPT